MYFRTPGMYWLVMALLVSVIAMLLPPAHVLAASLTRAAVGAAWLLAALCDSVAVYGMWRHWRADR